MIQLVLDDRVAGAAGGGVPGHKDGEGRGWPREQVGGRPRQLHLGLGGDVQGGAGLTWTLITVSQDTNLVPCTWLQTLDGDFLQRSTSAVDDSLPGIMFISNY